MAKQQFYEPMIQEDQEAMQIRGFQVQIGGTYVLMDDIVTALREYAQSLDDPDAGALVHGVATWLSSGAQMPQQSEEEFEENGLPPAVSLDEVDPADMTADVDRVEVYPNAEGKWFARSIDTGGNIMKTTHGSFDKTYVLKNAGDRWPGIPVYELQDAHQDSMWTERGHFGPSPKRLWAGIPA